VERHVLGTVFFLNAIPATFLAYMLPQQQSVFGIEDANIKLIPLHIHFSSDPPRRQAAIGGIDFDATGDSAEKVRAVKPVYPMFVAGVDGYRAGWIAPKIKRADANGNHSALLMI
jgi:hypothetical protein